MPRNILLGLPAVALLLTGGAFAQSASPGAAPPLMTAPRADDQPTTDAVTSPSGVGGSAPSEELQRPSPPVASLPPDALSAPQAQAMVGTELRTRDGQPGGRIMDFTLAEPDGRITRVVLAPNAVMGLGAKLVSVPVSALTTARGTPALDMDAAELANAPDFAYGTGRTLVRQP